ncbi:YigZ family protein [Panacibacter ginsenosidivorans]|uniref:YigZ family protein n=1 Tax=Panacibacter ginsenosidivorans TaxID=1813871 RepID=A0A5B8V7P0_9BACT|nr:YigZ family protein [Panacibacter ginsenosidivorans]QEC67507.1 YigZ family protein [Panacibacter ginsenosidivorans]
MQQKEFYNTVGQQSVAEFKDRGSRFLAYAFPIKDVEEFKNHLQQLKKEHPKAVHHCFAYRIGLDGNNFRVSDDGEPSGTAGKPILGQIDSKELTNTLVVVVRYFGGTLLGVPGLINAYKNATSMALQLTTIIAKAVEVNYMLQYDYTQMNDVMILVKKYNCSILAQETQLFCILKVGVPLSRLEEFLYKIRDLRNIEVQKIK